MANGITIDSLYEAFMDIDEFGASTGPTPFAEDVFGFFKDRLEDYTQEEWAQQWGSYLPTFDPAQTHLAERERDLAYSDAMDTLETTQAALNRVYTTEMDTLSTSLGKELSKGREIAGGIGLRSGAVESAVQDTIATTGSKAKDFGDRTIISRKETDDKYNSAMVDSALDFDKTERQEKEEFYNRTMAAIMRLMDEGAFDARCEEGQSWCAIEGRCMSDNDIQFCGAEEIKDAVSVDICAENPDASGCYEFNLLNSSCLDICEESNAYNDCSQHCAGISTQASVYNLCTQTLNTDECLQQALLDMGLPMEYVGLYFDTGLEEYYDTDLCTPTMEEWGMCTMGDGEGEGEGSCASGKWDNCPVGWYQNQNGCCIDPSAGEDEIDCPTGQFSAPSSQGGSICLCSSTNKRPDENGNC